MIASYLRSTCTNKCTTIKYIRITWLAYLNSLSLSLSLKKKKKKRKRKRKNFPNNEFKLLWFANKELARILKFEYTVKPGYNDFVCNDILVTAI